MALESERLKSSFLQALIQFLSKSKRYQSERITIPDKFQPLEGDALTRTVQVLYSRESQYVRDYMVANGVDDQDCDELINRISGDLTMRIKERPIRLEVRNILAISGNAIIIRFQGQIIKYPLNKILEFMIAPEISNHHHVLDLYEEWENNEGNEKILDFVPKNLFCIPFFQYTDSLYNIEFVGKSLDMHILIDLIFSLDMNIETRMKRINKNVQTLYQESSPAQLQYLLQAILAYNIPLFSESNLTHSELLSLLLKTDASYISREQYWALNSFLDYSWTRGFKYMDKMIDNVTLNNGKLYLIDFGICDTFNPKNVTYTDKQEYEKLRGEMVEKQLTPFIIDPT